MSEPIFKPAKQTTASALREELEFQIALTACMGGNFVTLRIVDAMAISDELQRLCVGRGTTGGDTAPAATPERAD